MCAKPVFPTFDSISNATVEKCHEYEALFREFVQSNEMYISLSGNTEHESSAFQTPTQPANGMVPLVIMINGVGRSGKDSFIQSVYNYMPNCVMSYSVIDAVRAMVHNLCMPTDATLALNADQSDLWVSNHTHFISHEELAATVTATVDTATSATTYNDPIKSWVCAHDPALANSKTGYTYVSFPSGYIVLPKVNESLISTGGKNAVSCDGTLSTTPFQYDEANKADMYRQFLYDVKEAWQKYNNGPINDVIGRYLCWIRERFLSRDITTSPAIFFVNTREVETTDKLIDTFNSIGIPTIKMLVVGNNKSSADYKNDCDSNVDKIPDTYYDVIIRNTSTLDALDLTAHYFTVMFKQFQMLHGIPLEWYPSRNNTAK